MLLQRIRNFLLHNIILIIFSISIQYVSGDDANVMALLAKSISPAPSGWSGQDFCDWQGVNCDKEDKVTSINLASKSLSGTIPPEITQLSSLKYLSLQRNNFTGSAPPLSQHSSLEEVNLDNNNFDSIPKDFLVGLTSLRNFSINNNENLAPWTIPEGLRNSSGLTSFLASRANIAGEIPDIFGSLPSLQNLRLSYNNMTGSLPKSFANSGIQNLYLNNVGFSGTIDVLGQMKQLREVWLHVNIFTGPIPDLSACTELSDLELRDNALTGVIPDSLTKLSKLKILSLQDNKLQGPVPSFPQGVQATFTENNFCQQTSGPCDPQVTVLLAISGAVGYPATFADSWVGNNPCQSWKFIQCNQQGTVTRVNFEKQNLVGTISPAFANLTGLTSLLLNDNELYGNIPASLTGLRQLQIIDISNNNISGRIPAFSSTVTIRTSGNVYIGQDVKITPPPGSPSAPISEANNHTPGENASRKSSISPLVIVIPVVVFFVVLAVIGFVVYRKKFHKKDEGYKWVSKGSESGNSGIKMLSASSKVNDNKSSRPSTSVCETPFRTSDEKGDYHVYDGGNITIPIEVLREVTDNFSDDNVIGKGGFGIVYKGQLHDGKEIAVKRMEASMISDKGLSEFRAEIEVLTKVRHRNLVALHGYCDNGNERLLVYEYMPQGCLGQHLFEWEEQGFHPLNWKQRVTIALDVARGVEYLHSLAQQSFIHRDLKPSNVLLGDDLRAKVSDFGLVKSAPDGRYSMETRLAGTFGYLAPEYAATGRVTTKVDVYAFGVVLMEILTGRKALDDSMPEDRSHLVTWFRRIIVDQNAVMTALDPVLCLEAQDQECFQSILKVTELAGHCTARESYQRPDMSHAVNVLSPLVEQWKPGPREDDEESIGLDFHMTLPQVLQKWKANEDYSSSVLATDFYSGNTTSTDNYGTSSTSSGTYVKPQEFSSSFDTKIHGR